MTISVAPVSNPRAPVIRAAASLTICRTVSATPVSQMKKIGNTSLRAPKLELLEGPRQGVGLGYEPAMRVEHQARFAALGFGLLDFGRQQLVEDAVHVAGRRANPPESEKRPRSRLTT
jgi:hypothetical protein